MNDNTAQLLRQALHIVDAYRAVSGGDGDITAACLRGALSNHDRSQQGYTGHNAVGGLQAHSTGDRYPWTVIAQGIEPQYRAYNCNTEQRGPLRDSAAEAGRDCDTAASIDAGTCGNHPAPSWLVAFLKVHQPRNIASFEGAHS